MNVCRKRSTARRFDHDKPKISVLEGMLMKQQRGFTLAELMVVLAMAAVLTGMAVPSFRTMIADNRLATATNTFVSHLALARSEAIKLRTTISLCRSGDPDAAAPVCAGAGSTANDWTTGWLVFANVGTAVGTFDAGDTLLRVGAGFPAGGSLAVTANAVSNASVTFRADGTSAMGGTAVFTVCDDEGDIRGRQLTISTTGRSVLLKGTPATPLPGGTCP